jgi:pSer/pThr/pTyr-binding forkhead associated (FHA) protein
MQDRYALRFESGERRGERIPIAAGGFTVGRRTGSTLQILDPSVSGKHAEITLDERGPLLRDLGSTNGTRVRGERVLETRLAHGDAVLFGNVELVFEDGELAGSAPRAGASGAGTSAGAPSGGDRRMDNQNSGKAHR